MLLAEPWDTASLQPEIPENLEECTSKWLCMVCPHQSVYGMSEKSDMNMMLYLCYSQFSSLQMLFLFSNNDKHSRHWCKILLGGFTIHSLCYFWFKEINIISKLLIVAQLTTTEKHRSEGTPADHLVQPLAQRRVKVLLPSKWGYVTLQRGSFPLCSTGISTPTAHVPALLSFGCAPDKSLALPYL